MADDTISLDQRRAKKGGGEGPMMRGSVNDLATRKEAIEAAVGASRTVYEQIAEEQVKAMAELERQVLARVRPLEDRVLQLEEARWSARILRTLKRLDAWWAEVCYQAGIRDADYLGLPDPTEAHTPEDGAIELPPIAEFAEWGVDADAWLAQGGVAVGPDAIHVGPKFRRLRCPNTEALRIYAEALGGSREDIAEGETSKTVDGEVLEDCRRLLRGEAVTRKDTKPELVQDAVVPLHHESPLDPGKCVGCGEPWPCPTRLTGAS